MSGSRHTHLIPFRLLDSLHSEDNNRTLPKGVSTSAQDNASRSDFSVHAAVLQRLQRGAGIEPSTHATMVEESLSHSIRGANRMVVSESPGLEKRLSKLVTTSALALQSCSIGRLNQKDSDNQLCFDEEMALNRKSKRRKKLFGNSRFYKLNKKLNELKISKENNEKNLIKLAKKHKKAKKLIEKNSSKNLTSNTKLNRVIAQLKKEERVVQKNLSQLEKKHKSANKLLNKTPLSDSRKNRVKKFLKTISSFQKISKKNPVKIKNVKTIKTLLRKRAQQQELTKKNMRKILVCAPPSTEFSTSNNFHNISKGKKLVLRGGGGGLSKKIIRGLAIQSTLPTAGATPVLSNGHRATGTEASTVTGLPTTGHVEQAGLGTNTIGQGLINSNLEVDAHDLAFSAQKPGLKKSTKHKRGIEKPVIIEIDIPKNNNKGKYKLTASGGLIKEDIRAFPSIEDINGNSRTAHLPQQPNINTDTKLAPESINPELNSNLLENTLPGETSNIEDPAMANAAGAGLVGSVAGSAAGAGAGLVGGVAGSATGAGAGLVGSVAGSAAGAGAGLVGGVAGSATGAGAGLVGGVAGSAVGAGASLVGGVAGSAVGAGAGLVGGGLAGLDADTRPVLMETSTLGTTISTSRATTIQRDPSSFDNFKNDNLTYHGDDVSVLEFNNNSLNTPDDNLIGDVDINRLIKNETDHIHRNILISITKNDAEIIIENIVNILNGDIDLANEKLTKNTGSHLATIVLSSINQLSYKDLDYLKTKQKITLPKVILKNDKLFIKLKDNIIPFFEHGGRFFAKPDQNKHEVYFDFFNNKWVELMCGEIKSYSEKDLEIIKEFALGRHEYDRIEVEDLSKNIYILKGLRINGKSIPASKIPYKIRAINMRGHIVLLEFGQREKTIDYIYGLSYSGSLVIKPSLEIKLIILSNDSFLPNSSVWVLNNNDSIDIDNSVINEIKINQIAHAAVQDSTLLPQDNNGIQYTLDGKKYIKINTKFYSVDRITKDGIIVITGNDKEIRLALTEKETLSRQCRTPGCFPKNEKEEIEVIKDMIKAKPAYILNNGLPNSQKAFSNRMTKHKATLTLAKHLDLYEKLDENERDIIRKYTRNQTFFNNYLKQRLPIDHPSNADAKKLKDALSKIPGVTVESYRGATVDKNIWGKKINQGDVISSTTFMSTSLSKNYAKNFVDKKNENKVNFVYFKIIGSSGRNIAALSRFQDNKGEAEILYMPKVTFKVLNVHKEREFFYVILEELENNINGDVVKDMYSGDFG